MWLEKINFFSSYSFFKTIKMKKLNKFMQNFVLEEY